MMMSPDTQVPFQAASSNNVSQLLIVPNDVSPSMDQNLETMEEQAV